MESQITELFLYKKELKFNEIEKKLKIRSNKLAYHLKKLVLQGILSKSQEVYTLSEPAEPLIPYISEKKATLPVILIHIGNNRKAFLIKREKRPYQGYISLPAGRLMLGESIPEATRRIMWEKYNIKTKFKSLHSISLEHVKRGKNILHSFLLIFVSAKSLQKIQLQDIQKEKEKTIKSDYHLLTHDRGKKMKIPIINSQIT